MNKIEGHFSGPSKPSHPSHPIKLLHVYVDIYFISLTLIGTLLAPLHSVGSFAAVSLRYYMYRQIYTLLASLRSALYQPRFARTAAAPTPSNKKSPTFSNVEIFEHDPQRYDFQNYNWYVCFKNELLHPQKEKSRTCCNFEIFDHDPQLDMKFET